MSQLPQHSMGRPGGSPSTITGMLQLVLRSEGVLGLYRGITPTILGILPYAGLKFYVYQSLKQVACCSGACCNSQAHACHPCTSSAAGRLLQGKDVQRVLDEHHVPAGQASLMTGSHRGAGDMFFLDTPSNRQDVLMS